MTSTGDLLSVELGNYTGTWDEIGPWIMFNTDGKIYFRNSTSPFDYYIMDYSAGVWYNVTLEINTSSSTYDIYIGGSLKNSTISFYTPTLTKLDYIIFESFSGGAPTSETCDAYVDDIAIWSTAVGGYGGSVEATATFRKLQHIHAQFAIGIPVSWESLNHANEGYVEFGIDYCYNDIWIENGWKIRINITDANIAGTGFGSEANNWLQLNVSWYNQEVFIKNDILYTLWEGGPGGLSGGEHTADYFRLWLDLWFNKVNASTVVGGRVNSYYYGMTDYASPHLRWLLGADWGPMIQEVSQSMYFGDLEDTSGNIISAKQIEMMRIRVKVWRSANYDYRWVLRDYDILSFEFPPGEMMGINTPIFVTTKTPDMPGGGFLDALRVGFSNLITTITNALGPAMLNFWNTFVGFLDTVFTAVGWENGFSQMLSWINSLMTWLADSFSILILILTQVFSVLSSVISPLTSTLAIIGGWVTSIFSGISGMITYLNIAIVDSGLGELFVASLLLIGICLPFLEIVRMEQHGFGILFADLSKVIDVASFLITTGMSVIRFFVYLVTSVIESIPVVE